ncbi:hypothetical protein [Ferrimonas balearica]|uniref:hypothetical protein n=1 Tax=Ferrimonas balearica TaxID=44012 RepID=UPI001F314CE8|nr:hypothetical protein [Ferrimonas balearica]MBY6093831.1 hypothetical protein [Ferrimonas balearica]
MDDKKAVAMNGMDVFPNIGEALKYFIAQRGVDDFDELDTILAGVGFIVLDSKDYESFWKDLKNLIEQYNIKKPDEAQTEIPPGKHNFSFPLSNDLFSEVLTRGDDKLRLRFDDVISRTIRVVADSKFDQRFKREFGLLITRYVYNMALESLGRLSTANKSGEMKLVH